MSPKLSKCTHTSDSDSEVKCHCPLFVPRTNPHSEEANICDGCMHTISWHMIISESPSPSPSQSASAQIDAILSTYQAQGCTSGSINNLSSSKLKGRVKATEAEARQEAVSGFKQRHWSDDEDYSPKVCTQQTCYLPVDESMDILGKTLER
jgi:hypothetical protein